MKTLRQIVAVTGMNLRSLPQRLSTSLVIVVGIAGVVAVLVSVLAMSTGMMRTLEHTGRDDRVIVLRNGSTSELASALPMDAVRLTMDAPGVRHNAEGKPIAIAETLRMVTAYKKEDSSEVHLALRGVGPMIAEVRPELKIIEGRMFNPAVFEIIVGKSANRQFKDLNIGDRFPARGVTWTVVGIYSSGGDSHESELMADAETVNSADHRGGYQLVTALLDSKASFQKFKDALTSNPGLAVDVAAEPEYLQRRSKVISRVISTIAYVVGGIMAVGAIFGALNTLYSAVSARVREIATLRAIGFGSTAMVISVLVEALLLALIGGLIGSLLAWLFFDGYVASTSGGGNGQMIFELSVTPLLVAGGLCWALIIGLVGGLFPAVRAARLPVATALRAV
ncbi:MAG TPA: ABC transporter permease [Povalibacter sp.]|jgi:putative ABC transport system permease protein|nr:ABC transporter permease [Povalibacter sp.]